MCLKPAASPASTILMDLGDAMQILLPLGSMSPTAARKSLTILLVLNPNVLADLP